MERRVLIVSATEGFIIKGIETKLKSLDLETVYSAPTVKDLEISCKIAPLIILYTDDSIEAHANAYVYIKDHCAEEDKQVLVIGGKEEYETLKNYIPESMILEFFERPLDMQLLLDEVEKYMEQAVKHAKRKNLLIVDDDVSYMSMIMDWLKDAYRVSLANSGMEAITWLTKNKADLMLLDYEMPVISGPQVLEMIRAEEPEDDHIPVMFLTGKGDKESVMKVLALKPVGYILKSVDRKELRDTLEKYFAGKEGGRG